MVIKYCQGDKINFDIVKWVVEEESEISNLPKSVIGSTAYVITTGESWMADSKGSWHIMNAASDKDPIACDCVEELTIWDELPEPVKV